MFLISPMIFNARNFSLQLLNWFDQSRRDLPWRLPRNAPQHGRLDPYFVLVSEAMLQQTQVSTVVPYFNRFTTALPTIQLLAGADEQVVLRLWQGLGYYSRARNLHAAARKIVSDFGGLVPDTLESLRLLPGVGRYTAGAIASIAYNRRAPILDGNVARVLCRIDRIESDSRERMTLAILWARAEQILPRAGGRIGDFNSALMELGAMICTPRNPQCLVCPVNTSCQAYAAGVQDRIPPPRKAKQSPLLKRWTFCIRERVANGDRYLIEQRPATGRWAGMWQFLTIAPTTKTPTPAALETTSGLRVDSLHRLATLTHTLTHRQYHFTVYTCEMIGGAIMKTDLPRRWIHLSELDQYPLTGPHVKIAQMLKATETNAG